MPLLDTPPKAVNALVCALAFRDSVLDSLTARLHDWRIVSYEQPEPCDEYRPNHQMFFAPVKLKRFIQLKPEWYINQFTRGALVTPLADKVSDHGITTAVTFFFDRGKQH